MAVDRLFGGTLCKTLFAQASHKRPHFMPIFTLCPSLPDPSSQLTPSSPLMLSTAHIDSMHTNQWLSFLL